MDDKSIMNGLLVSVKSCCDLFEHGAVESSTENIRQTFTSAFNDCLSMGDTIYQQMTSKGWYQNDTAPQQKIMQTKQKYSSTC